MKRLIEGTKPENLVPKMSSRAVRKALKRLEAQKELQQETASDVPNDEEDEEEDTRGPSNPFAMVQLPAELDLIAVE